LPPTSLGTLVDYANLANTHSLALLGDPGASAYELLFSFSSPEEKNEFLNLVRSNEEIGRATSLSLRRPHPALLCHAGARINQEEGVIGSQNAKRDFTPGWLPTQWSIVGAFGGELAGGLVMRPSQNAWTLPALQLHSISGTTHCRWAVTLKDGLSDRGVSCWSGR